MNQFLCISFINDAQTNWFLFYIFRDAMGHAHDIETCLLQNVEGLVAVNVQLNLNNS